MNSETKKIFNTKQEVTRLLEKYVEYRDDDERLVSKFWYGQLKSQGIDPATITGLDLLVIYSQGKTVTPADLIVRARAKVQQELPALRGLNWESRHAAGKEVRQEINSQNVVIKIIK